MKPRIGLLTAIHGRPAITRAFLGYYADELPGLSLLRLAVCTEGADHPEVPGWLYAYAPNRPLSDKWQHGLDLLRRMDVAAVVVMGSDDFVTMPFWDLVRGLCATRVPPQDVIRLRDYYVWEPATGLLCQTVGSEPGAGMILTRRALERIGWALWPEGKESRLDAAAFRVLARAQLRQRKVVCGDALALLDVKGGANLWQPLAFTGSYLTSRGPDGREHQQTARAVPEEWLEESFPGVMRQLSETVEEPWVR